MHYYFTCPYESLNDSRNPIPLQFPLPLLILAWTSVIPFFLNFLCLCSYAMFPSLRKPPGSFLCFQALLYLLKDGFEIFVSVLSTFYTDPKYYKTFALSKLMATLCLILTSLILGYSTALNIYLINVSKDSSLYSNKRTFLYHLGGWMLAIIYFTLELTFGSLRSNAWGESEYSDGSWDLALPAVFTSTLVACIFYVWKAYKREGYATNSKNLKFIKCFYFYFVLDLFYILAKIANIVTYQYFKCSKEPSFDDLNAWEKIIVFSGHFLEIMFTYIVFVIQFTDPHGRECIKSILCVKKAEKNDQSYFALLPENSESGVLNVQPTIKQHLLNSILIGMNYVMSRLRKVDSLKLPSLKTNKNEVFVIRKDNFRVDNAEIYKRIEELGTPMYEGNLTIRDVNVLIHMKHQDPQLIAEFYGSLNLERNRFLKIIEEENQLLFYTHDGRFIIRILSRRQVEKFVNFGKNLFEFRFSGNRRSSHIEKIVGVFQFNPSFSEITHYFLVAKNSVKSNLPPLSCSFGFQKNNLKKFNEIKSIIRDSPIATMHLDDLIEDINFLSKNRIVNYSVILNVCHSSSSVCRRNAETINHSKLNPEFEEEGGRKSNQIEIVIDKERAGSGEFDHRVSLNQDRQWVISGLLHFGSEREARKYGQFMVQKVRELLKEK